MLECLEFREEKNHEPEPHLLYGKFSFSRLEKGQGLTLANTLRRILLYEIPAVGITSVFLREVHEGNRTSEEAESYGPYHEFSSLPAVKESVLEILYKLKGIVFENSFSSSAPLKGNLKLSAATVRNSMQSSELTDYKIKALQIALPKELRIVNPDHIVATLMNPETPFELEFTIEKITQSDLNSMSSISGRALNRSTRNRRILPIDGTVFPVKKVNYTIEQDSFDKEIVFFEVWTNGGIHPREALFQSLEKAKKLFGKFIQE